MARIIDTGGFDGVPVDYLDGVVFGANESYLFVGVRTATPGPASDYTGQGIYYRSIQHDTGTKEDRLTMHDYFWRWDTDWFWCSRAFGAQNPRLRRWWPRRYRRSSVYWKLVALDRRFGIADRIEKRNGRPPRERVVQDVELPLERTTEFLEWFLDAVPIAPIWLCPLRLRDHDGWSLYPIRPGHSYVNVGFWSSVPVGATDGATNRLIEEKVGSLDGHKSLYSDSYYSRRGVRRTLWRRDVQDREEDLRPGCASPRPLREGGATTMTTTKEPRRHKLSLAELLAVFTGGATITAVHCLRRQQRRSRGRGPGNGPADSAWLTYLATAPGELGLARAYVAGDLEARGVHPGDPYELLKLLADKLEFTRPSPRLLASIIRSVGIEHL